MHRPHPQNSAVSAILHWTGTYASVADTAQSGGREVVSDALDTKHTVWRDVTRIHIIIIITNQELRPTIAPHPNALAPDHLNPHALNRGDNASAKQQRITMQTPGGSMNLGLPRPFAARKLHNTITMAAATDAPASLIALPFMVEAQGRSPQRNGNSVVYHDKSEALSQGQRHEPIHLSKYPSI